MAWSVAYQQWGTHHRMESSLKNQLRWSACPMSWMDGKNTISTFWTSCEQARTMSSSCNNRWRMLRMVSARHHCGGQISWGSLATRHIGWFDVVWSPKARASNEWSTMVTLEDNQPYHLMPTSSHCAAHCALHNTFVWRCIVGRRKRPQTSLHTMPGRQDRKICHQHTGTALWRCRKAWGAWWSGTITNGKPLHTKSMLGCFLGFR